MSKKTPLHQAAQQADHGSTVSYFIGFILSLVFTIIPYHIVVNDVVSGWTLMAVLGVFAIAQLMIQLVFFLHIGSERRPHWNLLVFLFMVLVVAIVAVGSLWIMYNLDYNMMSGHQVEEHLLEEEGIRR